jgi:cytochrome c-type biogenesis protein CcmH/NrfG
MKYWNDYFYGPVAAIRPYLFQKCFLLVIATDALVLMTERGARYGIDSFNVAHFAWLDAIHPVPTATWYVGILMLVSVLAYTLCFTGSSRAGLVALAVLYTYAWAMSRHDSYLHHYMISLILTCMAFFPRITYANLLPIFFRTGTPDDRKLAGRAGGPTSQKATGAWFVIAIVALGLAYRTQDVLAASWAAFFAFFVCVSVLVVVYLRRRDIATGPLASAWAYRLLGATVGVIYIYTSAAKADAEWCGGHTLQRIGDAPQVLAPFARLAGSIGVSADWFWAIAATIVIPVEITIALSYFAAVLQDEPSRKWTRRWCIVAWILAIALHLNNELMGLSIQWFGYYMMFLATFFFLPQRVLLALGACVVLPAHWWHTGIASPYLEPRGEDRRPLAVVGVVTGSAVLMLYAASRFIGLPGALWALPFAAAWLILYVCATQLSSFASPRRKPAYVASAVGLGGLAICAVVSQSTMRHDYYWVLGTEQQDIQAHIPESQRAALTAFELARGFGVPDKKRQVELLINMGLINRRLGRFPTAIEHYRQALEVDRKNAHVYLNLGVAYQVAGDLTQAAESFRQATALRPDYVPAHLELGRTLETLGDLTGSLKSLRAAQKLRPNDLAIQQDVARVLRRSREGTSVPQTHAKSG